MKKITKLWLTIASLLVILGGIIFVVSMASINWDFSKITTCNFETNTHEITETYTDISIITTDANIELVPSQDNKTSVVFYEKSKVKHSVELKDDTLTINVTDKREWYDYIGFSFTSPQITVYVPHNSLKNVTIKSDTGNVKIPQNYTFETLDISVHTGNVTSEAQANNLKVKTTTGNVSIKNIVDTDLTMSTSTGNISVYNATVNKFTVSTSTGDMRFDNVVVANKMTITTSTGNVNLNKCDAGEICIKTSTGDVKGSLLTSKNFKAKSITGNVFVPRSDVNAGLCEITVTTGNIKITIVE